MKKLLLTFFIFAALCAEAQSVKEVWAEISGGKVMVHYTLNASTPVDVLLSYSSDVGSPFSPCISTSGHLKKQTSGDKIITWDCIADKVTQGNMLFKVTVAASDTSINYEIEMAYVRGGSFTMGCTNKRMDCTPNESPAHIVTVDNFYIGKYEITQAQWKSVMDNNPSGFVDSSLRSPVERVSWNEIQEFIRKLNAKTGKNYRLPTEVEWEYAARGGNASKGYKYSGGYLADEIGWSVSNSGSSTHPVGTKSPNELGIYDMSGNVWEWCSDFYGDYAPINPADVPPNSHYVIRGGGWSHHVMNCRVSRRGGVYPDFRYDFLGFRLARSPE
jgi:formylglycine-generating enzyme required for sulfatase activity